LKFSKKEKIFLGIETTTDIFSIAVGNEKKVLKRKVIKGRKHSEFLVPGIEEVLKEAGVSLKDLKAVGAGIGPGSFTGTRVGLSSGITIAQILDIPVYGISLMDLAGRKSRHPVIKAFRDKYYYAQYDKAGSRKTRYRIISRHEKEKLRGVPVKISAKLFLKEIDILYKSKAGGDWRSIEPIYVMDTIYKPKKRMV